MKFNECVRHIVVGFVVTIGLVLSSVASCGLVFALEPAFVEQTMEMSPHSMDNVSTLDRNTPEAERETPDLSAKRSFPEVVELLKADDAGSDKWNEIHSSFVEVVATSISHAVGGQANEHPVKKLELDSLAQLGNGLADTGQPVTSDAGNVSSLETNATVDSQPYMAQAEPRATDMTLPESTAGSVLDAAGLNGEPLTMEQPDNGEESHKGEESSQQAADDIPSFSEWAQKQMEEADRKNVNNASLAPVNGAPLKLRSKNYASPDCGAKIVAANPEAQGASNVLTPSRDEYLLNACLNRVWLVIELCDSIQAKKIDVANFELFSSSPKEFSVSVSDRFPSRDWRVVGQFTASDVRDVQSYTLQEPHLFGKFVKIEVQSHYGSEHFCPVSLLRVFGTSVMEVLETEEEIQQAVAADDEDEEPLDAGEKPRNLYGIARDAVKSIVKAAEALVIRVEPPAYAALNASGVLTCVTPAHLVICDRCSDALFQQAFFTLACKHHHVFRLIALPFVKDAVRSGPICVQYGVDFGLRRPTVYPLRQDPGDYLSSLFPPHYMVALCNALAVCEKKGVFNVSHYLDNVTISQRPSNLDLAYMTLQTKSTCSVDATAESALSATVSASQSRDTPDSMELIRPTKTLDSRAPLLEAVWSENATQASETEAADVDAVLPPAEANEESSAEKEAELGEEPEATEDEASADPLDSLLSELKALESSPATIQAATTAAMPPQKESVFVRLSNRIKALERNMSLSSQYLEELSRRYKRQVEEMSRTLNRTLAMLDVATRQREEREKHEEHDASHLRGEVATLSAQVATLVAERSSWRYGASVIGQHLLMVSLEAGLFLAIWFLCRRGSGQTGAGGRHRTQEQQVRRKSVEGVSGHGLPTVRRKRPSEVALNIAGTYSELLITESPMAAVDGVWSLPKAEPKRRKRKRRDLISKSTSGGFLLEKVSEPDSTCGGDVEGRRASLSELATICIPSNGVQHKWSKPAMEASRVQEVVDRFDKPSGQLGDDRSCAGETKVPYASATKESLDDVSTEKRSGSFTRDVQPTRRVSSPAFMRTAVSSRAARRVSEDPASLVANTMQGKPDNWDFWHGSRKSSQINLVPTPRNDAEPIGDKSAPKKASGGLKKMVKRFF